MTEYPYDAIATLKYKSPPGADGLSFAKGENVTILGSADEAGDWLRGRNTAGDEGIFPEQFIERVSIPVQPQATSETVKEPLPTSSPPKPSGNSFKDRIAAFNKSASPPPIVRSKPAAFQRKAPIAIPAAEPIAQPAVQPAPTEQNLPQSAGLSTTDAKESINRGGGSLKDRIAALQGLKVDANAPSGPGKAPPKPWKKPSLSTPPADSSSQVQVEEPGQSAIETPVTEESTSKPTEAEPEVPAPSGPLAVPRRAGPPRKKAASIPKPSPVESAGPALLPDEPVEDTKPDEPYIAPSMEPEAQELVVPIEDTPQEQSRAEEDSIADLAIDSDVADEPVHVAEPEATLRQPHSLRTKLPPIPTHSIDTPLVPVSPIEYIEEEGTQSAVEEQADDASSVPDQPTSPTVSRPPISFSRPPPAPEATVPAADAAASGNTPETLITSLPAPQSRVGSSDRPPIPTSRPPMPPAVISPISEVPSPSHSRQLGVPPLPTMSSQTEVAEDEPTQASEPEPAERPIEPTEDAPVEMSEEEEEAARRQRLAARMAALGGMKMGMYPMPGRAPVPVRKQTQASEAGSPASEVEATLPRSPIRQGSGFPMGGFALPGISAPRPSAASPSTDETRELALEQPLTVVDTPVEEPEPIEEADLPIEELQEEEEPPAVPAPSFRPPSPIVERPSRPLPPIDPTPHSRQSSFDVSASPNSAHSQAPMRPLPGTASRASSTDSQKPLSHASPQRSGLVEEYQDQEDEGEQPLSRRQSTQSYEQMTNSRELPPTPLRQSTDHSRMSMDRPRASMDSQTRMSTRELIQISERFGSQIFAKARTKSRDGARWTGDNPSYSFVLAVLSELSDIAPPGEAFTFGSPVLAVGSHTPPTADTARNGDVCVWHHVKLKPKIGASTLLGSNASPHVGIVCDDFDVKKNKIKIYDVSKEGRVQESSYALDNLKEGSMIVYRALPNQDV